MISTGGKVYIIHWPSLQDYFVDIPMHWRDGDLRTMQHGQMHSELNTNKIYLIRFHPGDIHWPFLASSIVKTMFCVESWSSCAEAEYPYLVFIVIDTRTRGCCLAALTSRQAQFTLLWSELTSALATPRIQAGAGA